MSFVVFFNFENDATLIVIDNLRMAVFLNENSICQNWLDKIKQ